LIRIQRKGHSMSSEKREPKTNSKQETTIGRRDALKALAAAASATTLNAGLSGPAAAQAANAPEKNPYGSLPGTGISMPTYYRPTPSIKNRNSYFPQSEEMRVNDFAS
jgi:ribonuclease Z